MIEKPVRNLSCESVEVDCKELRVRQDLRESDKLLGEFSHSYCKGILQFLESPFRQSFILHVRQFALKVVYRKSESIQFIPLENPLERIHALGSTEVVADKSSDVFSCVIAEVIDGMTLVGIHDKRVEVREILRSKDFRNLLETVRTEVEILKILEIHEIWMQAHKTVCTNCKSLELSKFGDIFSRVETAEELIGIRIKHNLLSSSEILYFKRNALLCLEHEELNISHTALVRTVLPYAHIVPMFHLLGSIPFGEHAEGTANCKDSERVTSRCADRDRKGSLLNNLESIVTSHRHLLYRRESHIGNPFHITGIDIPLEMNIHFTRAHSPVQIEFSFLV